MKDRIESLEALRGLAAIVVVLWHSMLAFMPQYSGTVDALPSSSAVTGEFWFFVLNGEGAVAFFFTLSGFVLVRRAIIDGDARRIARGMLKRWPRLALPVTVATLTSWALFRFGLYHYQDAAVLSHSPWLATFGNAMQQPIDRSILDPLGQGLILTFLRGDAYYDTSLWTMRYEFFGSFAALGLAVVFLGYRRPIAIYCLVPAILLAALISDWYVLFIAGFILAVVLPSGTHLRWFTRTLMIVGGLYLLGYHQATGAFAAFDGIPPVYPNMVGSILLISSTFDVQVRGPVLKTARFLGALSFPIYLLHALVICSIGSLVFVWSDAHWAPNAGMVAGAITLIASVVVSLPLISLNRWWVRQLNVWTASSRPEVTA